MQEGCFEIKNSIFIFYLFNNVYDIVSQFLYQQEK